MATKTTDKRQERKAASRTRILHEAAAAIRSEGAERISVQEVMARAGLTVGGFYAHFTSKDDLIAHAVAHMFDERYAAFWSDIADKPAEQVLRRFIDRYLSLAHCENAERGCPVPALSSEIGRMAEPAREAFVFGMERLTGGVSGLLRALGHPDPDDLARSVVAELTGAIGLARIHPVRAEAERQLAASRVRIYARLGIASTLT